MSLVRAERRRLFKRRSVRIMLALALLILSGIAITFTALSRPHDAAALAVAEQRAQQEFETQRGYHREFVAHCRAEKEAGSPNAEKFPEDCFEGEGPVREDFKAEYYMPFRFDFAEQFRFLIMAFAAVMVLVAFVVGATFVGAEWNSGAMMNLLLWRPRRIPTLLTKLGVLLGAMFAATVTLGALWTAAFWAIGRYDGTMGAMSNGVWRSLGLDGLRALGLVLIFAAAGFALASLGRHTAMALGAAIGVALVSEVGVPIVADIIDATFYQKWQLSTYAIAWLQKQITFFDYSSCDYTEGVCKPVEMIFRWQDSAGLFGVVLVLLLGAALWSIRRRDVT